MKDRLILIIILISLFSPILSQSISSQEENPWWKESWSFRQSIEIPFDTNLDQAKYQPADIYFKFNNPCWAKDTKHHSIRVIYQYGGIFKELESQIYNLNFTDEETISSCSIVFLIPEYSNGDEKYFVYYDESEKNKPDYEDHVSIEDSYYRYEPVSGITFNSWYYGITQDNYLNYAIIKKGSSLGNSLSQQAIKLKEGSTNILPKNGEHVTTFSCDYWYLIENEWIRISSSEKLVYSDILIDGNLMVKCIIVSSSENGLIKTTNVYKYYFCPSENQKRVHVNVKHELDSNSLKTGEEIDVSFVKIAAGGIKSSIEELNSGNIPPYLHFYSENERVVTFEMDTNPEGIDWQEVIGKKDDYDLGSFSWFSVDYGKTGNAHGIILDSNNFLNSYENEEDGGQIHLYQSNSIQLPNIDGKFATIHLMRNAYEPGRKIDNSLPENYVVTYSADFFSTKKGGYKQVEEEALIYQKLIQYQPDFDEEYNKSEKRKPTYNMHAYVDLSRKLAKKFRFSTLLLKNTYLSAELFKDNKLIGLSRVGRIPLTEDYWIDWKNISIYRKAIFNNLEEGKYLIKIYINNLFLKNKDFIGYKILDLNENISTTINCNQEGVINLKATDQYEKPVKDVELRILEEDVIISKTKTSEKGSLVTGAPCSLGKEYKTQVFYNGFLVKEEKLDFGLIKSLIPQDIKINLDLYSLRVNVNNQNLNSLELDLHSKDINEEEKILPDEKSDKEFLFNNLLESDYILEIRYNDFYVAEEITVNKNISLSFDLKNIYLEIFDKWNITPDAAIDVWLSTKNFKRNIILNGEKIEEYKYYFKDLYPGEYLIKLTYKKDVYEKDITINNKQENFSFVFPRLFNFTAKIYDKRGNLIHDAEVELTRQDKKESKKTFNGITDFSIPPGKYICSVYHNDNLISKRKIDILVDKEISIVTKEESNNSYMLLALFIPVLFIFGLILYKKNRFFIFIKILVIFIIISSIFFPWWTLSEEKNDKDVKTETNMFILPSKMITVTSHEDYISGEFSSLDKDFVSAVDIIPYLIIFGIIFLLINIFLKLKSFNRLSFIFLTVSFLFFILTISVFYFAMSLFSEELFGGIYGSELINVNLFGETSFEKVTCNWGTSTGFYLALIATVITSILFFKKLIETLKRRFRIVYLKKE